MVSSESVLKMSQAAALEAGSRHDLRVGLSPDAPDEADFRDDKGVFGYAHSYEFIVPVRRTGAPNGAVPVWVPAALHLLPQP